MSGKAKRVGNEFTTQQLLAIEMLADGDLNKTEIQEKLDISADTLWRWRKNPQFMDAVIDSSRELVREQLPSIYKKLGKMSTDGDHRHMKILLDHLDKLEENRSKNSYASISFTWGGYGGEDEGQALEPIEDTSPVTDLPSPAAESTEHDS